MTKGQIVSGGFGEICIRQKAGEKIQLGELLVADDLLLQVYDLKYGSQLSQENRELIAGLQLEEESKLEVKDASLRNYVLAFAKPLINIKDASLSKELPKFFSSLREVKKEDLIFLTKPKNSLYLGDLRSGNKDLGVEIFLDGKEVLSHHILIPATTGRGKSNLCKVLLWDALDKDYCGFLVLDPHDEYYGRNKVGLKDHEAKNNLVYYTPSSPPPGARSLKINIKMLRPHHFLSVLNWTDPQIDAMYSYYKYKGEDWLLNILLGYKLEAVVINEMTVDVVKRRLMNLLGIKQFGTKFECTGIFDFHSGETTIKEVANELEKGKTVIIDTSSFSGTIELLVGGLFATEIFDRYKRYKMTGELDDKPVISVVLEEAPRVLGKDVLEHGSNVFDQIAREGRKFKIGLVAITQLPSLIPRAILANINTKIILGIEMAPERDAIIDSASQDLSKDARAIASLDKGEAIITSNFARFAMPVKIPLFEDIVKRKAAKQSKKMFVAVKQ